MNSGDEGRIAFYLAVGFAAGFYLFFKGFALRRRAKAIESIPTSKVRSLAVGPVEVLGRAVSWNQPLKSHFAGAECVYYQYRVREKRGKHWYTRANFRSPLPFYLEDDTGKVLVRPQKAELHLDVDRQYSSGVEFRDGLERLGIRPSALNLIECTETFVGPGDEVYVLGAAVPDTERPMGTDHVEALCLDKTDTCFFVISDSSEKELLKTFSNKMYLCLYGGPALSVACLIGLLAYFNVIGL